MDGAGPSNETPVVNEAASADELARVYLRGRDVACPGCGYNRRDGVAAACPECEAGFDLAAVSPVSMARSLLGLRLGLWIVIAMCVLDSVSLFYALVNTVTPAIADGTLDQYPAWFVVQQFHGYVTTPVLLMLGMISLRSIRRSQSSGRRVPRLPVATMWIALANIVLARTVYLTLWYLSLP